MSWKTSDDEQSNTTAESSVTAPTRDRDYYRNQALKQLSLMTSFARECPGPWKDSKRLLTMTIHLAGYVQLD
jgi:hypothetical protein